MADENSASGQAANEDNKGDDSQDQSASQAPDATKKPDISPQEQARREAQSQKDKEKSSESDNFSERMDFLEAREMERVRSEFIGELLSDTETYPNVSKDDPMFKYATSKEEVKEIATQLQNRFKEHQQEALRSVQSESEQSLTDEEIAQREKDLEKETRETGRPTFGQFMNNLSRRKKA